MANPKAQLQEFFQCMHVRLPAYSCQQKKLGATALFSCTLTLPPMIVNDGEIEAHTTQGEGRKKKDAEAEAARAALAWLQQHPLYPQAGPKPVDESLWRTIATALSPKVLGRDHELLVYILLCQRYLDGWLPVSILTQSRAVRAWLKKYQEAVFGNPGYAAQFIRLRLLQEEQQHRSAGTPPAKGDIGAAEGIVLHPDGLAIRLQTPYVPANFKHIYGGAGNEVTDGSQLAAQGDAAAAGTGAEAMVVAQQLQDPAVVAAAHAAQSAAAAGVLDQGGPGGSAAAALAAEFAASGAGNLVTAASTAEAALAAIELLQDEMSPDVAGRPGGPAAAAVVVPADLSQQLQPVVIPAGGCLLSKVAAVLECTDARHVILHGRVGHKVRYVMPPEQAIAAAAAAAAAGEGQEAREQTTAAAPAAAEAEGVGRPGVPTAATSSVLQAVRPANSGSINLSRAPSTASVAFPVTSAAPAVSEAGTAGIVTAGSCPAPEPVALPLPTASMANTNAAPPAYTTANSTDSLVVHKGPAAMDFDAGKPEVRGPLRPASSGSPAHQLQNQAAGGIPPESQAMSEAVLQVGAGVFEGETHVIVSEPCMFTKLGSYAPAGSAIGYTDTAVTEAADAAQPPVLNMRATWLAGHAVYGDVLLTSCRPSMSRLGGQLLVKWENFDMTEYWRAASVLFPGSAHVRSRHAPMAGRLPAEFLGHSSWHGMLPKKLLDDYLTRQVAWLASDAAAAAAVAAATAPARGDGAAAMQQDVAISAEHLRAVYQHSYEDIDNPQDSCMVTLTVPAFGSRGRPVTVNAGPAEVAEVAEQQAALAALHLLQQLDVEVLLGADKASAVVGVTSAGRLGSEAAPEVSSGSITMSTGFPLLPKEANVAADTTTGTRAPVQEVSEGSTHTEGSLETKEALPYMSGLELSSVGDTHRRRPVDGNVVKVSYRLYIPAHTVADGVPPQEYMLEQQPFFSFAVGTQAVLPQLDEAVRHVHVQGWGRVVHGLSVPLEGFDPFEGIFPTRHAVLGFALLEVKVPEPDRSTSSGMPGMFSPALSLQRYSLVAQVLQATRTTTVVDVGCGEGRLLEYLVTTYQQNQEAQAAAAAAAGGQLGVPLTAVAGVDISNKGIRAAQKRLSNAATAAQVLATTGGGAEGTSGGSPGDMEMTAATVDAASSPQSGAPPRRGMLAWLYQGSALTQELERPGGWGVLHGCDATTFIEVIEHLEPDLVAQVGPCLLGGLQPRTLIVMTPNWEYNAVMRAVELAAGIQAPKWPGPPGRDNMPLRNTDHRFEWTRQEFQQWAQEQATQFGYGVTFQGIGKAVREGDVLDTLLAGADVQEGQLGCASQAAIFSRLAEPQGAAAAAAPDAMASSSTGAPEPVGLKVIGCIMVTPQAPAAAAAPEGVAAAGPAAQAAALAAVAGAAAAGAESCRTAAAAVGGGAAAGAAAGKENYMATGSKRSSPMDDAPQPATSWDAQSQNEAQQTGQPTAKAARRVHGTTTSHFSA